MTPLNTFLVMKDDDKKPPTTDIDAIIGRHVAALSKQRGMTHEDLTEIIGINSTGTISELLGGKRRWNTSYIKGVVTHFGCSIASLFVGATPHDMPRQDEDIVTAAYNALSDDDRRIVDRFLFGGKNAQDDPLETSALHDRGRDYSHR